MKPATVLMVVLSMGGADASAQKAHVDLYGDRLPKHAVGQLGTSRFRPQADTIDRISWSPDGRFLATLASPRIGTVDPGVEIWNAETQLSIGPPKLIQRAIHAIAWSPDCRQLAVCPDSGSVEVWDLIKKQLAREFHLGDTPVRCIDWSPDGKWIAAGRKEGNVSILDAESLTIEKTFERGASSLDFSGDSRWLAACHDNKVYVWKTRNGRLRYDIELMPDTPETRTPGTFSIEISPVGRSLVVTGDHTSVIDFSGKQPRTHLLRSDTGEPLSSFGISFNSDGNLFATAGFPRALLWDADSRELLRDYPAESGFAVDFSPDGGSLAFALRRLAIVDLETGLDRSPRAAHRRIILGSAVSPDGQSAYTIASGPTIRRWDTRSTLQTNKLRLPFGSARTIDVSRDGKLIAVGAGNLLYFVDANTMKISREPLEQKQRLTSVEFSPTDDLVVARSSDGIASFINPVTREAVASIDLQVPVCHLGYSVFSSEGTRLALVSPTQSRIDILDAPTRKALRTIQIHEQMVSLSMPTCFLPDGKSLVSLTASPDSNKEFLYFYHIDIQDLVTGDRIRRLASKWEYPAAIACSPQGDLIAVADRLTHEPGKTAYHAQVIRVFSTVTGDILASFNGHFDTIRTLQFSRDGSRLYSASQDTTVLIWDVTSARARIPRD